MEKRDQLSDIMNDESPIVAKQTIPKSWPLASSAGSIKQGSRSFAMNWANNFEFSGAEGDMNPTSFIECIMVWMQLDEINEWNQQKACLTRVLKGSALDWYVSVWSKIEDFEEFKYLFIERFGNHAEKERRGRKLLNFKQYTSVWAYTKEWEKLMMEFEAEYSEEVQKKGVR